MRLNVSGRSVCVVLTSFLGAACAKRPQAVVPTPEPAPSAPTTPAPIPVPGNTVLRDHAPADVRSSGPWTFAYTPATLTYEIAIEGMVALFPDSTNFHALGSTTQRVTIVVNTDGSVQLIDPPAPSGPVCDSITILAARALQIVPKLPAQLSVGSMWSDSTTTENCVGTTFAHTIFAHTYTVTGDTVYNGIPALHIVRSSVISAHGEGTEGQHRVMLSTFGTGMADLYFDVAAGHFLGSNGTQTSTVDITASGQLNHFLQRATERVTLVQTP